MIELQAMLCGVGCAKVQTCLECYTTDVSITTLLYIQHSLFQHYSLFKYIFTEEQQVEVVTTDVRMYGRGEGGEREMKECGPGE